MTSNSEALPVFSSTPDPTNLLLARLDNWKHVISVIEDYVEAHLSSQKHTSSDLEKIKKSISDEPKFDYKATPTSPTTNTAPAAGAIDTKSIATEATGPVGGDAATSGATGNGPSGIAEAFREMRLRNDALLNKSVETESLLKAVIPQLQTVKGDIEKHHKGLRGTGKVLQKDADKARAATQKQLEAYGSSLSSFSVLGSKVDYKADPYLSRRHVLNLLDAQVLKENALTDSVLSAQNNFASLEQHIIQVIQQATKITTETLDAYNNLASANYLAISDKFAAIPLDYEWEEFTRRQSNALIGPNPVVRTASAIEFPGSHHPSSKPLISGILQRKEGKLVKTYNSSYYVLTASGLLFGFKSEDPAIDAEPDFALLLKDCQVGPLSPRESGSNKFKIYGKDLTSTVSLRGKKEFSFKASTYDDMVEWHEAIVRSAAIESGLDIAGDDKSPPTSPVASHASAAATATTTTAGTGIAEEPPTPVSPAADAPLGKSAAQPVTPVGHTTAAATTVPATHTESVVVPAETKPLHVDTAAAVESVPAAVETRPAEVGAVATPATVVTPSSEKP